MHASGAAAPAVSITRVLAAPRSLVWKVWTDPIHVMRWWGPHGFTVPTYEADVRPGGALRYEMRAPDGTIFPATGTFEDVVAEQRLVLAGLVEIAGSPAFEARTTVTFEDRGPKTLGHRDANLLRGDACSCDRDRGCERRLDATIREAGSVSRRRTGSHRLSGTVSQLNVPDRPTTSRTIVSS